MDQRSAIRSSRVFWLLTGAFAAFLAADVVLAAWPFAVKNALFLAGMTLGARASDRAAARASSATGRRPGRRAPFALLGVAAGASLLALTWALGQHH